MASAFIWNLQNYRGDALARRLLVSSGGVPIDFTGSTVRSQVRVTSSPSSALIIDLSSYFTLGADGSITLVVPDATMNGVDAGQYSWSVVVVDVYGQDTTYFIGTFTLTEQPTGNS